MKYTRKWLILILLISALIGCYKKYTYEELQNLNFHRDPIGEYFWSVLSKYEKTYNLSEKESQILGNWLVIEKRGGLIVDNQLLFFPNGLAIILFEYKNYMLENNKSLDAAIGLWEIDDDVLNINTLYFSIQDAAWKKEYVKIQPYRQRLINVNDIDILGYTKKPFYKYKLPDEIEKMVYVINSRREKQRVRMVYTFDLISNPGVLEIDLGEFEIFPEMAEKGHSGLDIVRDFDLLKYYIDRL